MGRIRDLKDLRSLDLKDIKLDELFDDIRALAGKRAGDALDEGRLRTRRVLGGAHGDGAMFTTFAFGLFLGALAGAAVALLATPMPGVEARRRLGESVDKVRTQAAEWQRTGDGQPTYASSGYAESAYGQPSYTQPSSGVPSSPAPDET